MQFSTAIVSGELILHAVDKKAVDCLTALGFLPALCRTYKVTCGDQFSTVGKSPEWVEASSLNVLRIMFKGPQATFRAMVNGKVISVRPNGGWFLTVAR